jgi:hypothetical protein
MATMNLQDLAVGIGARVVVRGRGAAATIERLYAGDRISDLLNQASPTTLVVTNLVGPQLVRAAELMDVPGICLVGGHEPEPRMLAAAQAHGMTLMVSPVDLFETCARLHRCRTQGTPPGP